MLTITTMTGETFTLGQIIIGVLQMLFLMALVALVLAIVALCIYLIWKFFISNVLKRFIERINKNE